MLLQASKDFNIDLEHSWMVGDGENDVMAGKNAGYHTALIGTRGEAYGQDVSVISLEEFTDKFMM